MAFFDRFFKPKQTAAPPPPPPAEPAPRVPVGATIASCVVTDAVGVLALDGGEELRFGRSACKGFEPVEGARVVVDEVASTPRGWRAKVVRLDAADERYDALLAARDARAGLPSPVTSTPNAAAAARQLGLLTVLLRDPLPEGHAALAAWAKERGLPRDGVEARAERDLELVVRGRSVLTYPGRGAFPLDGLDTRNLAPGFDGGRAFLGFGTGLPGGDRLARIALGTDALGDPWGENGAARDVSRLVALLAPHAVGVVLHRAGELVLPIDEFVRMLGDLDDPECRPFAAWIDVGMFDRDGVRMYGTFGMDAFGLPDVAAPVDSDDRWSRSRRHEAVLYASQIMVRENRVLAAGDALRVPLRLTIGAWPPDLEGKDDAIAYAVGGDDGALVTLAPVDEPDAGAAWRDRRETIAVNAYQALFDRGLAELVPSDLERDVGTNDAGVMPHVVEVRMRHDGRGYLVVTNGFGRVPQPDVPRPDCAFIEVGAWAPMHTLALVSIVGTLAHQAHLSSEGWKPCDTLGAPIEELGIGGFVLADGGVVSMGDGPSVRLLLLVPLDDTEYAQVRGGGAADWLAANPVDPGRWDRFLANVS